MVFNADEIQNKIESFNVDINCLKRDLNYISGFIENEDDHDCKMLNVHRLNPYFKHLYVVIKLLKLLTIADARFGPISEIVQFYSIYAPINFLDESQIDYLLQRPVSFKDVISWQRNQYRMGRVLRNWNLAKNENLMQFEWDNPDFVTPTVCENLALIHIHNASFVLVPISSYFHSQKMH